MEKFHLFLSPVSMGYVPTVLVQCVIIAVLFSLKQKTTATRFFIGWHVCLILLVASLLLSTTLYHPIGGYMNWIGGAIFSLLAITLAIQFAYRFPALLYRRESNLVLILSLALWVGIIGIIIYEYVAAPCHIGYGFESFYYNVFCSYQEPFYSLSNNLFNVLHPLGFLWALVIWLRQSVRLSWEAEHQAPPPRAVWHHPSWWRQVALLLWHPKGREAKTARALALVFSVAIVAAILVPLEENQVTPVGSFAAAFLVSEALFILTYLDYSLTPITFKVKLVGVPLVTTMMLAGLGAPLMLKWTQEDYHETRHTEVHAIAQLVAHGITNEMPPGVRYVAVRPASNGLVTSSYRLLYTNDPALDTNTLIQQDTRIRSLMEPDGATSKIPARSWQHLTHMYPWLDQYVNGAPTQRQLASITPPEAVHSYRGHFDIPEHQFVRYNFPIAPDMLGEVGYSYREYRTILHARGLPLLWMLIGAIVLFLVVVPFFVQTSLGRPLSALLQGVHRVGKDNLQGDVPVQSADEIGFLTNAFNRMVQSLRGSREALMQEIAVRQQKEQALTALAATLEERVDERTQELQLAREEAEHAREKAVEANQAKSIFLANMSHELRTPLNAILGFAQVLRRSKTLPNEHREYIDIIKRSGDHLLTLINNVLDLSKIEAGRITLNETTLDLHHLLSDIEDMFRLRAKEKGLSLQIEYAPDVPRYIHTDEVKLRQVLINLLANAMKFTSEGGVSLQIMARDAGAMSSAETGERAETNGTGSPNDAAVASPHAPHTTLHIQVADTGPGIAPDELDKLFEAFAQASKGQQSQEGTGLGLAISRKFVQLMGGDITVQSEVGRGTVFTFHITATLAQAHDVYATESAPQVIGLAPGQPIYRILIVDDRADNRTLLITLLSPMGFALREAGNGEEALAVWDAWQPHFIWMDMRMPVLDGYETTRRIKATPEGQRTIVVALTASTFDEERAVVLEAGCDDFVQKPFREQVIYDTLATYLGVRYLYAEEEPETDRIPMVELSPDAFQTLPAQYMDILNNAALLGDITMLHQTIEQIRAHDSTLADTLYYLVEQFQFDQIVQATMAR